MRAHVCDDQALDAGPSSAERRDKMKSFLDQKIAHLDSFRTRMSELCLKMKKNELGLEKLRSDVANFKVGVQLDNCGRQ